MADKVLDKNGLEYLWTKLKTYFSTATNLVNGSAIGSLRSVGSDESTYNIGEYAFVEGVDTKASGDYAHAEGNATYASGESSHSEGDNTHARGKCSHAEGYHTLAQDMYSHAEGYYTTASMVYAHAEGDYTVASDVASHSEGIHTVASGYASHAQNEGTIAASHHQTAIGRFNIEDANDTYAVILGNGINNDSRSNAFTVDWDGNVAYSGYINRVKTDSSQWIIHTGYSKGDSLTAENYKGIQFYEDGVASPANKNLTGRIDNTILANGEVKTIMSAFKPEADSTSEAFVSITYPASDIPYINLSAQTRISNGLHVTSGKFIAIHNDVAKGSKPTDNTHYNQLLFQDSTSYSTAEQTDRLGVVRQYVIKDSGTNAMAMLAYKPDTSELATAGIYVYYPQSTGPYVYTPNELRINGHSENIGFYKTASNDEAVSLAAGGAGKTVASISLNTGRWIVIGKVTFPNASSATYVRAIISTTGNNSGADDERVSINGAQTVVTICKIAAPTADDTPYYLSASSSVARTVAKGGATIYAIRIQ